MPDPIQDLRNILPAHNVLWEPTPVLQQIAEFNQQRIITQMPAILAFEFGSSEFLLQLEMLSFGDRQLFRENSFAHFRGAVDFTITRQRWFFRNIINNQGPALENLEIRNLYSRLGASISRWMGEDHLIIVEYISGSGANRIQFDQQWRAGSEVRSWYENADGRADATHVHIQPDQKPGPARQYLQDEFQYATAIRAANNARINERRAEQALETSRAEMRQYMTEASQAREREQQAKNEEKEHARQEREKAEQREAEAREREAKAHEDAERARREKAEKEAQENEAKEKRDESVKLVPLARYADDPDRKVSLFEIILAVLKAGVTTAPEYIEKEDALDFFQNVLTRFKEMKETVKQSAEDIEWFGEDQNDYERYLNKIFQFISTPAVEDPSFGNVPWCGNGFIANIEKTLIVVSG